MNPLIKDQIESLRQSADPYAKTQATVLEVLCGHGDRFDKQDVKLDAIAVQTTATNGRVNKHDEALAALVVQLAAQNAALILRIEALEKPVSDIKTIWKSSAKVAGIVVVILGLAFGPFGKWMFANHDSDRNEAIKLIVDRALDERKEVKPGN